MKLVKRMVVGAAVAMTAVGLAFANPMLGSGTAAEPGIKAKEPESMTSRTTQGLFGNDVDDFMNVNEYQNVMPKNVFGYLGYGEEGKDALEFGLARQFKGFYLGGWFTGRMNSWKITNTKDDGSATKADNTVTQHSGGIGEAYGKVLFGINNMGIMANFAFKPTAANKYTDDRKDKKQITDNHFDLMASVKFGINLADNSGKVYKTWAEVGLNSKLDRHEVKKNGSLDDMTDSSVYKLMVNGGTSFDIYKANDITQTIDLALNTGWSFYPTKYGKDKTQTGPFKMDIKLNPAWTLAYEPEDSKFAVKTKIGLTGDVTYYQDYDKKTESGTTSYHSRNFVTSLSFKPSFAIGAIYKVIPGKFQFNSGLSFNNDTTSSELSWSHTATKRRNASSGSHESNKDETILGFKSVEGKIMKLSSGFTWTPFENIMIDARWEILDKKLFDKKFQTKSDLAANIWETVGKVIFEQVMFLVSVKL